MDMVSAGIVGLLFILLVVFCVLAAKTWHWINIVFLILCYLTGVGAAVGMSKVFELKNEQLIELARQEERVETETRNAALAVYGSPDSTTYDADSLRGANQALSLAMTGRGRVWSGGNVTADGQLRNFEFPNARPADDPDQMKLKDVLLYAFADGAFQGQPYPQSYIGTVFVAEETPEALKLQPVFLANRQEWQQPTTTWSLFEKMPPDRFETFKRGFIAAVESSENANEAQRAVAEAIKSGEASIADIRAVVRNYLKPEDFNLEANSAEYEELIDRYAFDGMSLGKIQSWIEANAANRVSKRFDPAPEEVFVKYQFKSKSSRAYKVDADGTLDTDGPFTPLGQAVEPSLHAGKDIEFEANDTVLVDQLTAEGYQRGQELIPPFAQQEDVEVVDRIYRRQLRDFPYMLSDLTTQAAKFVEETQRVKASNAVQDQAISDAEAQLQDRLNTTAGLEEDNSNLKTDVETIESLLTMRQDQNSDYRSQILSLQAKIRDAYAKIQERAEAAEREAFANR